MDSIFLFSLSTISIISVLVSLTFGLWLLRLLWPFPTVAGRRYPPVAGTILHQLFNKERIYDYHTELSRRYKTFRFITPARSHIYISDPTNAEYILKTNFANYGKGSYNYENLGALFGEGIFAVDGEKWRHQRKLASLEFSTKILRDFSSVVFRKNAANLAFVIADLADSNREFDIQKLLMRSTLDSIFKVGFGVDLNVLSGSSEEFARAFEDSNESTLLRYLDPLWKIKRFLNIGSEARLRKNIELIDEYIYRLIRQKSDQKSDQKSFVEKEDILSRFMIERESQPEKITDKYLRDITLNFIIAGRDTTAGTLSWFFYMLCKHPFVQQKIQQEVAKATGADESVTIEDFTLLLTEKALGEMQYLHAALTETLRLYPAVPLDGKFCFSDDTLPDGYAVRKGDMVDYQPYVMGRMENLWGSDVMEFKPERWLDEKGVFQPESPFKFTAFQSGFRICLGKEFAYKQMKIFAAVLIFCFKFHISDEKKIVNYRTCLTLMMDKGLQVRASRRYSLGC